eukprot:scaffold61115_cov62-Phaeocystis_antarctica.AAC.4
MAPIFESAEAQSLAAVFAQRLFYFRRGAEAEAERSGGEVVWGRAAARAGRGRVALRAVGAVSLGPRSTAVGPREL